MKGPLYKWGLFLYLNSMRVLNAVMAHKDFYWNDLPEEELKKYLVFTYNNIKTNIPNVMKLEKSSELDDRFYSEFAQIKYIRKNLDFDWIVINHYRRRLEIPDYNMVYVASPYSFDLSVKDLYALNHNIDDLNLITDIIMDTDFCSDYKVEWMKSLEDKYMLCYNMCSVSKDIFCDLVDIYDRIVDKFIELRNFKTFDDVIKHCNKLPNVNNNPMPYRLGGFLSERLTNCYFRLYAKKHNLFPNINLPVMPVNVKLLEDGMSI